MVQMRKAQKVFLLFLLCCMVPPTVPIKVYYIWNKFPEIHIVREDSSEKNGPPSFLQAKKRDRLRNKLI